ncbi:hypothetical protein KKA23_00305 [Patescibacteria group bacterium]|nr:hypothetical protein [Patescibacteria group bacterium]
MLIIIAWLILGILAYGMLKGGMKESLEHEAIVKYSLWEEVICLLVGMSGLLGLIIAWYMVESNQGKFSFCFRMPKELKRGHGKRIR